MRIIKMLGICSILLAFASCAHHSGQCHKSKSEEKECCKDGQCPMKKNDGQNATTTEEKKS